MSAATFDEWLKRQHLPDAASISPEQLALLRASYEESAASAAKVTRWTPRARGNPADNLYAVAVRDGADLWLLTWVKRFLLWKRQRQSPDANFKGHVQLTKTPISLSGARAVKAVCDPAHFNDVFELTPSDLAVNECAVAVDLVERGGPALAQPWSRIVTQRRHTGHVPEVVITIWESTYKAGVSTEHNAWT